MKIRDLDLDQYVIVYDIGKSENNNGMTVVGRVHELVFKDESENRAMILSMGTLYIIYDHNYFDLWSNYIESKTESVSENVLKAGLGISKPSTEYKQSNDLQQRKRNDTVNHPSHYNKGKIEAIVIIEQVASTYPIKVALSIGNTVKYLIRAPFKNGVEDLKKAQWYLNRAIEKWDVK
ncbi:DUF3310 domain-containing protein [Staphylococcus equorum]|uniref:DUF3310 domain-containing protein n=1 Tax=Staphylococcus equorum TaxID=246432 RepID=UPI002556F1D2|nr:DUF3310 domain-containing protein [Staphylococcus equorum]MDK9853158.1 DUF3310 domain-containing protein [Staphylococcus equorum]